jgi:hypothetical protein
MNVRVTSRTALVAFVTAIALGVGGMAILVGTSAAMSHSGSVPSKVLSSSAAQRSAGMAALQAKLRQFHGKKLTARQLRALGLRTPSKSLAGHRLRHNGARVADVGCTYWYTYQYAGFVWVNRYYCGPGYSYPWYPYYYLYDNFYLCPAGSTTNCASTRLWYWEYYLYYYPYGTWYTAGPNGYNDSEYGPYGS